LDTLGDVVDTLGDVPRQLEMELVIKCADISNVHPKPRTPKTRDSQDHIWAYIRQSRPDPGLG
jgi:hypothetical protein